MRHSSTKTISDSNLARAAAVAGIVGAILLALYFNTPALTNCPCSSASPQLAAFIRLHPTFLYAGLWLQAIGTLLCIVFFLTIVHLAGATTRIAGLVVIVASASLLSLVLVEGGFLATLPSAVWAGDQPTFTTAFALGNVFTRLYPLAPASATYLALGAVILGTGLLPRWLGYLSLAFGIGFEVAGLLAVFSGFGLTLVAILAGLQGLWIIVAAIALWRAAPAQHAVAIRTGTL